MKPKKKKGIGIDPRALAAEVRDLAAPLCEAEGYELIHVEFQREAAGRMLRLYIDKNGGVALDDCVHVSRHVGDLLDAALTYDPGPYRLEVSSPGIQRPLGRPADYERYRGQAVRIRVDMPIDGQKNFSGRLEGFADGQVTLALEQKTVVIPLAAISRARLIAE